jgi:hypothetical protein
MHVLALLLAAVLPLAPAPARADADAAASATMSSGSTSTSTPTAETVESTAVRPERSDAADAAARSRRAPTPTGNPLPPAPPAAAATIASTPTSWVDPSGHTPENLLAGPARCALRYLEAVRHAGPRPDPRSGRLVPPREQDYARARALTAPRTLEEIARRAAGGEDHPLAPWRDAARSRVLESFQLVAVRRAPRGAAVVTVAERFWRAPGAALERDLSEYLVARVEGHWKVVDRSPGQPFEDDALERGYTGFFDDPAAAR